MKKLKIIRMMPNSPVQVGEGCTVYVPGRHITAQELAKLNVIFDVLGMITEVPESMMNALTALIGCGPAYVSSSNPIILNFHSQTKTHIFRHSQSLKLCLMAESLKVCHIQRPLNSPHKRLWVLPKWFWKPKNIQLFYAMKYSLHFSQYLIRTY